jgi:hypothetical protein
MLYCIDKIDHFLNTSGLTERSDYNNFMYAICAGPMHARCLVRAARELGLDINKRGPSGKTPLDTVFENEQLVRILIEEGANPFINPPSVRASVHHDILEYVRERNLLGFITCLRAGCGITKIVHETVVELDDAVFTKVMLCFDPSLSHRQRFSRTMDSLVNAYLARTLSPRVRDTSPRVERCRSPPLDQPAHTGSVRLCRTISPKPDIIRRDVSPGPAPRYPGRR